jgi:adenosylcobyric acid synthase
MTASIMVQGVTSGAGKSTLTSLICLYLRDQGFKVAPFKALNLSLNSYVTQDGREIGIAQAFQAWAAGLEPESCMNPVLLKPSDEGRMQMVLNGRPFAEIGAHHDGPGQSMVIEAVRESYERLRRRFDFIVIEGSGSPVEINLEGRDIANMRTAEIARSPVLLVGDIDKGGVFAGLYGTYHLMSGPHQQMMKGFIINRFRGDGSSLGSGIEILEKKMSMPCLGVVPMVELRMPEEDSLAMRSRESATSKAGDVRKVWIESLQGLLEASQPGLDLRRIQNIGLRGLD